MANASVSHLLVQQGKKVRQITRTPPFLLVNLPAYTTLAGAPGGGNDGLHDGSDKFQEHVCRKCGDVASYNEALKVQICNVCENRVDFAYVVSPPHSVQESFRLRKGRVDHRVLERKRDTVVSKLMATLKYGNKNDRGRVSVIGRAHWMVP